MLHRVQGPPEDMDTTAKLQFQNADLLQCLAEIQLRQELSDMLMHSGDSHTGL